MSNKMATGESSKSVKGKNSEEDREALAKESILEEGKCE